MNEKTEKMADVMADKRSSYDHKAGVLTEPPLKDEPRVMRHQVDALKNIGPEEGQDPNGPVPRRGDPFAHQRDAKAAEAAGKKEAAKKEKDEDKK